MATLSIQKKAINAYEVTYTDVDHRQFFFYNRMLEDK